MTEEKKSYNFVYSLRHLGEHYLKNWTACKHKLELTRPQNIVAQITKYIRKYKIKFLKK